MRCPYSALFSIFLDFFRQLSTAFPACFTVERVNPKPQGFSPITVITSFCRKMGKKWRKKARCKNMELSRAFGERYQQYVSGVPAACRQCVSVPVCQQHGSGIAAVSCAVSGISCGISCENARKKLGFFTYFLKKSIDNAQNEW